MFYTTIEKIKAAREGADVTRFHSSRTVRSQSVGLHSFNMLCMLRILYPGEPPIELVWAILEHDVPERWIGDSPAPAKWWGIFNKEVEFNTDVTITEAIFGSFSRYTENAERMRWLHGLDILECICEARDELALGNSHISKLYSRALAHAKYKAGDYPPEIVNAIYEVAQDDWAPVTELGE